MNSIADFGVLGGPRFARCDVCRGVIALPDGAHMDDRGCQGKRDDVSLENNESVAPIQQVLLK